MSIFFPAIPEIIFLILFLSAFTGLLLLNERDQIPYFAIGISILLFPVLPYFYGVTFNEMFISDKISIITKYIFLINLIFCTLISLNFERIKREYYFEYYSLLMLATLGMMILVSANDLIVLYLGIELVSLCSYVLAGFMRDDLRSNEAGMKYLLIGTFGSVLLLYGITLIYATTGTTNFKEIIYVVNKNNLIESKLFLTGLIFIASSFALKVGTFPFYQWVPDVYEGAPTPITAFMSVGPKAAAFIAFGRAFVESFYTLNPIWSDILVTISIFTVIVGNLIALNQTSLKRMLAYSSVAHAGYMILGIAAGTSDALMSVVIYLFIYTFMNMGAFSILIATGIDDIDGYRGLAKTKPFTAFLMLIFMFSLTGIPPTAGFIAKLTLFKSVLDAGHVIPVIIAVIFSVVSAFYYLRIVRNMYMIEEEKEVILHPGTPLKLTYVITSICVILIGILPQLILGFAN